MPNEAWDYDAVAITQLYDANINGETRKVISQTNRNGFFYTWDRTNGQFLKGEPFTDGELDRRPRSQDRPAARLRSEQDRAGLCRQAPSATARRRSTCVPPITACRP